MPIAGVGQLIDGRATVAMCLLGPLSEYRGESHAVVDVSQQGHDWMSDSPTFDVEQRAKAVYFANQWAEAEHLYREVQSTSEQQGRQVARNMLGSICER